MYKHIVGFIVIPLIERSFNRMEGSFLQILAFLLYSCTMILGLAARYRRRSFGSWHHVLFAVTGCAVVANLLWSFEVSMIPVALVLLAMPFTRPRASRRHDLLAIFGLLAFGLMFLTA